MADPEEEFLPTMHFVRMLACTHATNNMSCLSTHDSWSRRSQESIGITVYGTSEGLFCKYCENWHDVWKPERANQPESQASVLLRGVGVDWLQAQADILQLKKCPVRKLMLILKKHVVIW
jgi:hypothetical protein